MLSNNQWSATFESNWLFGYDLHVKVWWMLISSRNISFMKFHWIQTLLFGQTWMGPIHIATYSDRHVMLMLKLYCYLFFYKKFHIKHTKQMLAQRKKKTVRLINGMRYNLVCSFVYAKRVDRFQWSCLNFKLCLL